MTSNAPSKPFWVCGKDMTQGCGKCSAAGVQIHLSSRECQKLVWHGHKYVCGSKPGQVDPPEFDEEEIARLQEVLTTHGGCPEHSGPKLLESLCRYFSVPVEEALTAVVRFLRDPTSVPAIVSRSHFLRMARGLVYDRLAGPIVARNDKSLFVTHNPFYHAATVESTLYHDARFLYEDITATARHRAVASSSSTPSKRMMMSIAEGHVFPEIIVPMKVGRHLRDLLWPVMPLNAFVMLDPFSRRLTWVHLEPLPPEEDKGGRDEA
ncbi:hypothetical protein JCM8547_009000 [Rhodosporidiobolus lusitaniae]